MGNRRRGKLREAPTRESPADALQVLLTANMGLLGDEALAGCPAAITAAAAVKQQEQTTELQQAQILLASWSQLRELVSWFSSSIIPADKYAKLSFATSLPKECRADVHTLVSKKFKQCCESVSEGFGDDRYVAVIAKGAAGRQRRVPQEQADHALALWLLYKQHRRKQQQQQQLEVVPASQAAVPVQVARGSSSITAGADALQIQESEDHANSDTAAGELAADAAAIGASQRREYSRDEVAQMLMQNKLTDELSALWFGPAGDAQRWSRDICLAAAADEAEEVQALVSAKPDLLAQNILDLSSGGQLPLHLAAASGAVDVLRVLLTAGADVAAKNGSGETALQVAQRCEQCGCEALLLQAGAIDIKQDSWQNFKL